MDSYWLVPRISSQCVGPGASHLSKLDSNSLFPLDHRNESTPAVGDQCFAVLLLLETKITSNFTFSVNYMLFFRIAEFTDKNILTGRILILNDNLNNITEIHYRSVVYLIINWSNQNACILRIPTITPWLPILLIHIRSKVKNKTKSRLQIKKKLPNIHILDFCQKSLHETHLLELFDKMYTYEMDPASII